MAPTYEYYGAVPRGSSRADPAGVIRRRRLRNGVPVDQAFTRNLRWERSDALYRCDLGYSDENYERITEAAAEAFVRRVTVKLGGDPDDAWASPDEGPFDEPRTPRPGPRWPRRRRRRTQDP
jgi:hypothetical protein